MVELLWLIDHLNFILFREIRVWVTYWHIVRQNVLRCVLKRNFFKSDLARDNINNLLWHEWRLYSIADDLRLFSIPNHFDLSQSLGLNPFRLSWIFNRSCGVNGLLLGSLFDPINSQLLPQVLVLGWSLELLLVELGDNCFAVVVALSHRKVVFFIELGGVVMLPVKSFWSLNLVVTHWVRHDSLRFRLRWLLA